DDAHLGARPRLIRGHERPPPRTLQRLRFVEIACREGVLQATARHRIRQVGRRDSGDAVALLSVAAATEHLDVLRRVAAPARDGDDVVELEVILAATAHAAAVITLPDED